MSVTSPAGVHRVKTAFGRRAANAGAPAESFPALTVSAGSNSGDITAVLCFTASTDSHCREALGQSACISSAPAESSFNPAHLLSSVHSCIRWYKQQSSLLQERGMEENDDEDYVACLQEIDEILESITRRMTKCDLEEFELDKSADFSVSSGVGMKNYSYAVLVMGVCEVLVEYNFTTADFSKSKFEEILGIFKCYSKLVDILKEKSAKGRSAGGNKAYRSLLSMGFVSTLLTALFRDSMKVHEESLRVLRSSLDFMRYAVGIALQKIQQLKETGVTDGPDGQNSEKMLHSICEITSFPKC
ncbi:unnamed protein product [Ranitomeya imitator]|uniref:Uncharacterized protein n=1 Tax=Ranitomeya imitator TaxID=111125 RepID=A0ABN9MIT5_9NEOB|nr:unnamed protein product [Ranitomeya imitator]